MANAKAQAQRREGQEGSRWINVRPTGAEIAKWFKENVEIADGLDHDHYVSGITLIQQQEKAKEVAGWNSENQPLIAERTNLVYVPYAKVETRVKYFHDLMELKSEDWQGVIEPVQPQNPDPSLPPGFFYFLVKTGPDAGVRYICCSMKVTVYKRGTVERKRVQAGNGHRRQEAIETTGETIIDAPPATKMIAVAARWGPDNFSMMKAETGAVGRALGLAGMLVIPGTGVATAEDMAEAEALVGQQAQAEPTGEASAPPADAKPSPEALTELRQQAVAAILALKEGYPDAFKAFQEWSQGRNIGKIAEIEDERLLRGLVTKAERDLQEAQAETPPPDDA